MASYRPRHLKATASPLRARGAALAASAAVLVPALAITENAVAAPAAPKAAIAPAAVTAMKTATGPSLSYGSRGAAVRTLQSKLNAKGARLVVDGSFGPKTRAAVRAFQAKARVRVSGTVGASTWKALGGYPKAATSRDEVRGTGGAASVLSVAYRYVGVPYRLGGSTPRAFDCSGFTSYVYRQLGVNLPRTARAQQAVVRRTSNPVPGDLVFTGFPASHVGIYVGNGMIIDSSRPGTTIRPHKIWGVRTYGKVL